MGYNKIVKPDEDDVLDRALKLPANARALIAGRLLESLDEDVDDDPVAIQAAWTEEIDQRRRDLASGVVKPMTPEEALRFISSDDPADDHLAGYPTSSIAAATGAADATIVQQSVPGIVPA